MTSSVRCAPVPGGQSGPVERRWETLYSRSLARIPGEKRDTSRDSDYLTGIKRLRRLYCNVGIGFHLQVLPDGRITGVHNENRYSKLGLLFDRICMLYRLLDWDQENYVSYIILKKIFTLNGCYLVKIK